MRTTIAIDDDVLTAAKELASAQRVSLGEVVSSLIRHALRPSLVPQKTRNGIPLLPVRDASTRVTSELIKQLEQDLP